MSPDQAKARLDRIRTWLASKHVGQAFQPAICFPALRPFSRKDLQAVFQFKRKLPHWELEGSTYFITFRVRKGLGNMLEESPRASMVEEVLWWGHEDRYAVNAYVIMPDHVHVLLQPAAGWCLSKVLQGLKGFSAREINRRLRRSGPFWQDESFDHLVRNEQDWLDKFHYIHENPVTAGLVNRPEDYAFSSLVTMYSKGRLESLPHIGAFEIATAADREYDGA